MTVAQFFGYPNVRLPVQAIFRRSIRAGHYLKNTYILRAVLVSVYGSWIKTGLGFGDGHSNFMFRAKTSAILFQWNCLKNNPASLPAVSARIVSVFEYSLSISLSSIFSVAAVHA